MLGKLGYMTLAVRQEIREMRGHLNQRLVEKKKTIGAHPRVLKTRVLDASQGKAELKEEKGRQ